MKKSYLMLLLVAMFAFIACATPVENSGGNTNGEPDDTSTKSKYDLVIDNLMEQCKDFDANMLTQGLPGEWKEDSKLYYDDEWETITSPWYVMGEMNCEGLSPSYYSFTAEGKGVYRCTPEDPHLGEIVNTFEWQYDTENSKLILNYEGYGVQRTVSGFNGEYIVLDYYDTTNKHNTRVILKRI